MYVIRYLKELFHSLFVRYGYIDDQVYDWDVIDDHLMDELSEIAEETHGI